MVDSYMENKEYLEYSSMWIFNRTPKNIENLDKNEILQEFQKDICGTWLTLQK